MARKYIETTTLIEINTGESSCRFDVTYRDGTRAVLSGEWEAIPTDQLSDEPPYGAKNEDWSADVCIYDAPAISADVLQNMSKQVLDAYMLLGAQGTRMLVQVIDYEEFADTFRVKIDGAEAVVPGLALPVMIGEYSEPSEVVGRVFARKV